MDNMSKHATELLDAMISHRLECEDAEKDDFEEVADSAIQELIRENDPDELQRILDATNDDHESFEELLLECRDGISQLLRRDEKRTTTEEVTESVQATTREWKDEYAHLFE